MAEQPDTPDQAGKPVPPLDYARRNAQVGCPFSFLRVLGLVLLVLLATGLLIFGICAIALMRA